MSALPFEQEQQSTPDTPVATLAHIAHALAQQDVRRAQLRERRVLVRVDFNVPVSKGQVDDFSRLEAALPTIRALVAQGAKVVLASHLGRPKPSKASLETLKQSFSLEVLCPRLREEFGDAFVGMTYACIGDEATQAVGRLQAGEILLLENTRFFPGDEACTDEFSAALAAHADVFVNDAFGCCHRDQGSVTGVAQLISEKYPGLLVQKEVQYLLAKVQEPQRPFAVVVGGSKVRDKIGVLWEMIKKAQKILVGGRMAFTFLAARGVSVGATQVEHDWLPAAADMLKAAEAQGVEILLPQDVICTYDIDGGRACCTRPLTVSCCNPSCPCIPPEAFGADIGPKSVASFAAALQDCRTIFWNGPMGRFELAAYAGGTEGVARGIAHAHSAHGACTIVGGGDTVTAVKKLGLQDAMDHLSTGGGASLQLIEGKDMPGLRALL